MRAYRLVLAVLACACGPIGAVSAERSGVPRLCPEDAPEGARLPQRPGCGQGEGRGLAAADAAGFRDVGGIRPRVGGRVSAEYGVGR